MSDDFLARSGVKELLAQAVAALLETQPANPVVFLAHQLDTSADRVKRSVRLIRSSPPNHSIFPEIVRRAFHLLAAALDTKEPFNFDPCGRVSNDLRTVVRADFTRVLAALCADFPVHIMGHVLDAIQNRKDGHADPEDVALAEFQRGVHVCVLLEVLLDVVDELCFSIDKDGVGEVKLVVLLSALENAARQAKQSTTKQSEQALDILRGIIYTRSQVSPNHTTDLAASSLEHDTTSQSAGDLTGTITLADLQEMLFQAVFDP